MKNPKSPGLGGGVAPTSFPTWRRRRVGSGYILDVEIIFEVPMLLSYQAMQSFIFSWTNLLIKCQKGQLHVLGL